LIIGAVVVVMLVALAFVARSAFRDTVEVRTAKVSRADLVTTISTNGKVQPTEDYQAPAPTPGVVKKVFVGVGEHVDRGQQLIMLDVTDARSRIAAAQATLDAAMASLKNMEAGGNAEELINNNANLATARSQQKQAASSLAALQTLQAKGAASANEVAAAQQRLSDANARIAQLQTQSHGRYTASDLQAQRAQVEQARAALAAAQNAYGSVDIRAPFPGTVYSVPVSQYDFVQGGEALLNMADLSRIQVRAYFDEPEIGKLKVGEPVKIVWDAKPFQTWHGHITLAPSTVITYGTRNVGECFITVDDAKGDLLPNTNVTVTVTVTHFPSALSLPREALRTEGLKNFVYRIVNGKLKKTEIQVGASNNTRFQITGGLKEGDEVALNSPSNAELKDDLDVKVLP